MSDLNMSHGKMSDFVSFASFGFTLAIKLRNFDFESHWSSLIFLINNCIVSYLNMSHGKIYDFVSFPLFVFTLVIKQEKFRF